MTDTLFCYVYQYIPGGTYTAKQIVTPLTAEGGEMLDSIGYGKVTIDAYTYNTTLNGVDTNDIIVAWTTAPKRDSGRALYITAFIVETRQYKDGVYEISGPDFIAELNTWLTLTAVGGATTVTTTALSIGNRPKKTPLPAWSTTEALDAAYAPRAYHPVTNYDAGDTRIEFSTQTSAQVGDELVYYTSYTDEFRTEITHVSDRFYSVEFADGLPTGITASEEIGIHSRRLKVADATGFVEGQYAEIEINDSPINLNQPTLLMVDRVDLEANALWFETVIMNGMDVGATVSQTVYQQGIVEAVNQLLAANTSNTWTATRYTGDDPIAISLESDSDTVLDTLMAIVGMTGWHFRRKFSPYTFGDNVNRNPTAAQRFPVRQIEYFPNGHPVTAGELTTLGTENRMDASYGEIFSLQTSDVNTPITHLIPIGGGAGAGKFDLRYSNVNLILPLEYPDFDWGINRNYYFIRDAAAMLNYPKRWHIERFNHIAPIDPQNTYDLVDAGNQLLRAACEWLEKNNAPHVNYTVECFTIAEPRPGDVVSTLSWSGVDTHDIEDTNLVITEVHHSVNADPGYRVTRLVLNKVGALHKSGEMKAARAILDLQRSVRGGEFAATNTGVAAGPDGFTFVNNANFTSNFGDTSLRALEGDVTISAPEGDVAIRAGTVGVNGLLDVVGPIRSDTGFIFMDAVTDNDWSAEVFTLRGIPRLRFTYRDRGD